LQTAAKPQMQLCKNGEAAIEAAALKSDSVWARVARWHLFKPKIPIWVNFGGYYNGRCWNVLLPFGLFTAISYILWSFGIIYGYLVYFSPFWYVVPWKIWQPWNSEHSRKAWYGQIETENVHTSKFWQKNIYDNFIWLLYMYVPNLTGANPTTFEFSATTPTLSIFKSSR
jgi:hypothetical protein